jgi:epidermal growth factor receptor substrate 15
MTKARDLSKLLSTANGKIAGSNLDVSFENISDTGTEGTKVASGTTAQRGSTTGQWRFNSTTGFFEGRGASAFSTLEPIPTITSVDDGEVDSGAGGNQTIVITGTNFTSGSVASFVGSSASFDASTTTIDSSTQITAVAPKSSFLNAQEPYKVKVTSATGISGTSATGLISVDNTPSWQTASGSLGTVTENSNANFSVSATDPDSDTVSYSETTSVLSGAGFSLNSSTGAITGTANAVSSDTTNTFTLRATANGKTTDRQFSIITADEGILGSAEFYIDPSNSSSWSGSGSTLSNITSYGSKSGSTTNLDLNNGTVTTNSGITYIQHNSSGTAPSATIGNISGNLQNYTIAFFLKVSSQNSNADTGIFMYGNKSANEAIGGNIYGGGTNQVAHYNYSNDTTFNVSSNSWLDWDFYVFRKVSGTKQLWINNTQITSTASVTNNSTSLPSNSRFDIGGRNDPSGYDNWNTQIGFCGIWTTNISDSDMTFLYNKFKGDYGL